MLYIVIIIIYKFINRQVAHKLHNRGEFFVGIFCTFWPTIGDFEIYPAILTQESANVVKRVPRSRKMKAKRKQELFSQKIDGKLA